MMDLVHGGRPYSPTAWGLARVTLWTVVFLWLIGALAPAAPMYLTHIPLRDWPESADVTPMMLAHTDPRAYRPDSLDPDGRDVIAWVGGSSLLVTPKPGNGGQRRIHTVADRVVKHLSAQGILREPVVSLYASNAQRIYAQYLSVLHAIRERPDMLVVTLNPFWVFNNKAVVLHRSIHSGSMPAVREQVESWPLVAQLARPAEAAWGLAAAHLPALGNRWDYNQTLVSRFADLHFVQRGRLTYEQYAQRSKQAHDVTNVQQPLRFWVHHGQLAGRQPADAVEWQRIALAQARPERHTINTVVLDKLLMALRASGIPSLVYLAPVAPQILQDARLGIVLEAIESRLRTYAMAYADTNVHLHPRTLTRTLPELKFRDLLHLYDGDALSQHLATEFSKLLSPALATAKGDP